MVIEDYILKTYKKNPNQELIRYKNEIITYKNFNHIINSYVETLNALNVNIKRVLIDIDNPVFMLGALCACNRTQKIPAIMPLVKYRIPNINYMKLSKSEFLLNNSCIIQVNNLDIDSISYNPKDVQCVIFSSGTEGKPKAIELTYQNIYSSFKSWDNVLNFNQNNTYLNILPMHHISGLSIFFRSIFFKMIHIIDYYKELNINQLLESEKINFISIVPKIINDAMSSDGLLLLLKKIDTIIIGGDKITPSIYKFCKKHNINAFVSYGMSETSSGIAGYFIKDTESYEDGYIGTTFKDNLVKIDNGKISIISKSVMKGYVGASQNNNHFNSSDMGCKKNGKLIFLSRASDIITSGGENINLIEISNLLRKKLNYNQLYVVGYQDNIWGEIPVLIYKSNPKINHRRIEKLCKDLFPKYMIPKRYISIDKIPQKGKGVDKELISYYISESLK